MTIQKMPERDGLGYQIFNTDYTRWLEARVKEAREIINVYEPYGFPPTAAAWLAATKDVP